MANFEEAFAHTMKAEGGYVHDPQDPGGETYKGIARARNSKWMGWTRIDLLKQQSSFPRNLDKDSQLQQAISEFYEVNYWDRVKGDDIQNQDIAESIFDFAVNAGPVTSAKLAQMAVGAEPDGVIGPKTLEKLNRDEPRAFLAVFAIGKISRYVSIVERRPESRKFFYGWIRRTLEGL